MSKWGHFSRAADSLAAPAPMLAEDANFARSAIVDGHRFYLPMMAQLDWETLRKSLELCAPPFDRYSILTEYETSAGIVPAIICVEHDGEQFIVVGATFNTHRAWQPVPMFVGTVTGDSRIVLNMVESRHFRWFIENGGENVTTLNEQYFMAVLSLSVLLGLANTTKNEVKPPAKVNRKRARSGKTPLYSYHVLTVAGQKLSEERCGLGGGPGCRSHTRRGHIRRLDSGVVWVRATLVRGRVPGFVEKDYDLSRKAALA